jgi:hypothetical protein
MVVKIGFVISGLGVSDDRSENCPSRLKHFDSEPLLGPGWKIAPEGKAIKILDNFWAQAGKWPHKTQRVKIFKLFVSPGQNIAPQDPKMRFGTI